RPCPAAPPATAAISAILAEVRRPPAVKPAPMPMPRPATEICPRTKRSPPSMNRTIRSAIAPSATIPATPTAIPAIVKAYPRRILLTARLAAQGAARLALPFESGLHRFARPAAAPGVEAGEAEEERERDADAQGHADEA